MILQRAVAVALVALAALPAQARRQGDDEAAKKATSSAIETDVSTYLQAMEKEGLLSRESGTPARLRAALAEAEKELQADNLSRAAMMLYALVESPAYTDFSDSEEYQNAEYDLGVALARSHAYAAAIPFFVRILERGPEALYYRSSIRRLTDIALETRDEKQVLPALEAALAPKSIEGAGDRAPVPDEAMSELHYLRGRAATDAGELAAAEAALGQVGKRSRFYAAALYLRGVARARRGDFKAASTAFCEIVDTPDKDKFTFYVDDRYFRVKDLARLGLGRIAHEQSRYDDSYYHYFQIPDDSARLPEALFEAAWSMYAKGEDETARDLLEELTRNFSSSPLVPEASLLRAHADLRSCAFDAAQTGFDAVVSSYEPLRDEAAELAKDPKRQAAFLNEVLTRDASGEVGATTKAGASLEDRLLALVRVDSRFVRLHEVLRGLKQEMADADRVADEWRELSARLAGGAEGVARLPGGTGGPDPRENARELLAEADAIERMVLDLSKAIEKGGREKGIGAQADLEAARLEVDELSARARDLRDGAKLALADAEQAAEREATAGGPGLSVLAAADAARATSAPKRAQQMLDRASTAAARLGSAAIKRLDAELTRTVEQARLGKIDAVIGQKRKLELEIEDLAAGRFPPEMFGRLYASGAIGDDEEYWPFEGEFWADEYEGFR